MKSCSLKSNNVTKFKATNTLANHLQINRLQKLSSNNFALTSFVVRGYPNHFDSSDRHLQLNLRSGPILAVLIHSLLRLPLEFVSPLACPPECYYKAKRKLSLISGYLQPGGIKIEDSDLVWISAISSSHKLYLRLERRLKFSLTDNS